ncbi:MAG: hypothetical protein WBW49_07560 [Candidatus Acidiferrum sp.]
MDKGIKEAERFRSRQRDMGATFVLTELGLAITFCEIGLTTRSNLVAERNLKNTRKAQETVARLEKRLSFTEQERAEIAERWTKLRTLTEELHRRLQSLARHS